MTDAESRKSVQEDRLAPPPGDSLEFVAGVFAPILGLQPAYVPIEIDEGWAIDRMTDEETKEIGTWSLAAGPMTKPEYAVRYQRRVYAYDSPDSPEAVAEIARIKEEALEAIELTVWALRLFEQGDVSVPLMIDGPPFREDMHGAAHLEQPQSAMVVYDLSAEEAWDFASFVREYRDGLTAPALEYAIRRFSEAETRQNPEDKIVDLIVACESLFLPDGSAELSYRMSLRFAFTLAHDGIERRWLFEEMKAAYAIRSWIVHGKTRGVPKLPNGKRADLVGLITFARSLGDLVRQALRSAAISAHRGTWPPDWDARILDPEQTDVP
jgi:hypothetical protein